MLWLCLLYPCFFFAFRYACTLRRVCRGTKACLHLSWELYQIATILKAKKDSRSYDNIKEGLSEICGMWLELHEDSALWGLDLAALSSCVLLFQVI